jgi:drug/metabolite transporter (DMT)-like permease
VESTRSSAGDSAQIIVTARTGRPATRLALGPLIVTNLLWAGTYVTGKIALGQLSSVELNAVRFTLAGLILSPVLIRGWRQIPLDRRSLLLLGQITLIGWVLNKALEYTGLALSTASDVALLIATESLFTALLSWMFLRERITSTSVLALLVGIFGAYLIVERGLLPHLGGGGGGRRVLGDIMVIGSLVLEAGYTIRGKTAMGRLAIPPLLLTSATLAGSMLVWVPAGVVAVVRSSVPQVSLAGWLCILYMAVGSSVLGYWLWFHALGQVDASAAAPTLFVQPLVGAALGIVILHDTLNWATLVGAGLICVSLFLVILGNARQSASIVVNESTP